jgi:hypothetical protein
MAVTAHVFPTFQQAIGNGKVDLAGSSPDTCKVLLIANGNFLSTSLNSTIEAMTTKASILANGSSALTELSTAGGYTAGGQTLTSVTCANSGAVTTISCANPSWTSATFTAYQAVFLDTTFDQGICYWDFGGAQAVSSGTFTLQISGSGLVTLTAS